MNKLAQKLKEQALKQWRWLSENPTKISVDYYETNPDLYQPLNLCPLCEYAWMMSIQKKTATDAYDSLCEKCPLYGNWRGPDGVFDVCYRVKSDDEGHRIMTYFLHYRDHIIDPPSEGTDLKLISDLAAKIVKNIDEEWIDRDISHMVTERSDK